jgi:hypothetical protein
VRRARRRLRVGLVVIILVPAGVARGQVGLRVPVMPPPPPPPVITPPGFKPPWPAVTPPGFKPPWPAVTPPVTQPAPDPAPAAPAPVPAPDPAWLWWALALAGVSSVVFVMILIKVYRARTRRIRIVAPPPGEAPIDVRGAWVGLTLPLVPNAPAPYTAATTGAVSGRDAPPLTGYVVNGKQAVDRLAATAPWAAAWWREHAPHILVDNYQLLFPADVCEVV